MKNEEINETDVVIKYKLAEENGYGLIDRCRVNNVRIEKKAIELLIMHSTLANTRFFHPYYYSSEYCRIFQF